MDNIITNILKQENVSNDLNEYKYVPYDQIDQIPLGSHVKFIDRNENVKSGGFLIKYSQKDDRTKTYIILKSNLMYKLYTYYYWIFYKEIKHEAKIIKTIRKTGLLDELPRKELIQDPTSTTMNIVIKSKPVKPKLVKPIQPKLDKPIKPKLDKPIQPDQEQTNIEKNVPKTKSNGSSKRDIFKALLESLDNSNK